MAEPVRKMPADRRPEPDWRREGDPYPYGSRWRRVRLPNGEQSEKMIPLTPEDLLDPQLGDEVTQSGQHFRLVTLLAELLLRHFEAQKDVLVIGDVKIFWDVPSLANPSPDIAVIPGVRDREKPRKVFRVADEGVRPCLIIEVVSDSDPDVRRNDYERKVEIYQKAGVPEYLILDQPLTQRGRLLITGHRLGLDGRYRRIEPDNRGRLLSETTGLLFGATDDGSLLITDARTGEPLKTGLQEAEARIAAEERARAAEAEVARLRAELARKSNP